MRKYLEDTNGTTIMVGDHVVYNRSGQLELGQVTAIKPARGRLSRHWPLTFRVANKCKLRGKNEKDSKVKDCRSIMVISRFWGGAYLRMVQ